MTKTIAETDSTDKQIQTITIPVTPSRDPEDYRVTNHFKNRLCQRVNKPYRSILPKKLIREGRITRLDTDMTEGPQPDYGTCIAFSTTGPRQRPWTLIAAMRPIAFASDDERHRVITIYQGTPSRGGDSA